MKTEKKSSIEICTTKDNKQLYKVRIKEQEKRTFSLLKLLKTMLQKSEEAN